MLAHMENVANEKKGDIMVGDLITSLAEPLWNNRYIRRLEPIIENNVLDMDACLHWSWLRKQAQIRLS